MSRSRAGKAPESRPELTSLGGPGRLQEGGGGELVQARIQHLQLGRSVGIPAREQIRDSHARAALALEEPVALLVVACSRAQSQA